MSAEGDPVRTLSVVIPVFQGADTLPGLVEELGSARSSLADRPSPVRLTEVVLVHDCGPDNSAQTIEALAGAHDWVRSVWLTRNYGQHPATIAGIAATSSDLVVTMDEDALHNPADIAKLIDRSDEDGSPLVYGQSIDPKPHSRFRNFSSRIANLAFRLLVGSSSKMSFSSFRLLDGPISRSLAAYCGHGVYLDVALAWVMPKVSHCPVIYRRETRDLAQGSGYDLRSLLSHFRRLVLSSGTRPLRAIALIGFVSTIVGLCVASLAVGFRLFGDVQAEGWTSVIIAISVFSGLIMMALGVVAEYLSVAVTTAAGRPLYLTTRSPKWSEPAED